VVSWAGGRRWWLVRAGRLGEALDTTPEDLRAMIDINLGAALWLSQGVGAHMRQRGSGAIVHVSARPAVEPTAGMAAYGVSKAALAHLTRLLGLGTRADMAVYQQYVNDLIDGAKKSLTAVDPTPFFAKYGNNSWAAVSTYQAAQVDYAAAPVIKKYTGVLAATDVYTASTTFILLESIRLDLGIGSQVHA
jgi:NAD(P)-dependent dehydrogenase (short-subunit alcohol dehydrogenase family)